MPHAGMIFGHEQVAMWIWPSALGAAAMWRGGEKILTDIEECVKRFDSPGVDAGVVSLSSWFEEEADLLEELDLYVSELDEKYQDMVDEGMEIEERINEL